MPVLYRFAEFRDTFVIAPPWAASIFIDPRFLTMKTTFPCQALCAPALSLLSLALWLNPLAHAQLVDLDSDSDGLIDSWEIQHFGSLTHPEGGPTGDPDGDTCDNLKESRDGTDPNDYKDCFLIAETMLEPGKLEISWNTVLGKRYQLEISDNLNTWKEISESTGTTPLNFFGTGGKITVDFAQLDTPSVTGGVTREIWFHGDPCGTIACLKAHINPTQPAILPPQIPDEVPSDGIEWRSSLKGPSNYGDNYGTRWRGFIVPKRTGTYNFYIAGRHQCEFWLDTTGNTEDGIGTVRQSYLHDQNLTEEEDWDYLASLGVADTQKSGNLSLTAGRRYYFEILHNHNTQWDHLAVGWKLGGTGTISVVPGDCLQPLGDFVTGNDYASSNAVTLLASGVRKFVRIKAFGPLSSEALDADGDQVADEIENVLDGYQFFRAQSAFSGQSDGVSLTSAGIADPSLDVLTVEVNDALGRENNGTTTSGIPRVKDVTRFHLKRSGSLAPQTILFDVNGASDPMAMGNPVPSDYDVELPDGSKLNTTTGTYAVTIPFGGTQAVIEINPVLDEIVEYPEEINLVITSPAVNYTIGTPSQGTAALHDARDDPEFNKYYIASFSKDDAAATATSASGSTLLVLNGSNTIAILNDYFENLTSAQTNTHLHKATLDPDGITFRSGSIVESITDDGTETGNPILGPVSNYTYLIEPRGAFSVQDIIDSLEYDNPKQGSPTGTTPLYDNKHTVNNGSGEIWALYKRRPASELSPENGNRIPPTPPIEPIDPATEPDKLRREVTRFLTQATFGPTEADVDELIYEIVNTYGGDRIAAYDAWLTMQWALPQTLVRDLTHALDMQEFTLRGYFDPARNGSATNPPVAPSDWPNWVSQDVSDFDSLQVSTWQAPDADFPLTSQQENQLDGILGSPNHNNRRRAQWTMMANAKDQLRQRVAFAVNEILVVSEELAQLRQHHIGAARWSDMLAENADDHFREAIEDVTYSAIMGKYLSHLQNSSEASSGVPPDENYAREIMQLFTIGLFELWDDGFVKLDPVQFNLVPTYLNEDIKELARVMTGMSWSTNSAAATNWDSPTLDRTDPNANWYDDGTGNLWYSSRYNYPMAFYDSRHDTGDKTIAGGLIISNNGTPDGRYTSEGDKDLRDVHNYLGGTQGNGTPKTFAATWSTDASVNHQNPPPFISRRIIQRLVTSNPSGPYLYRVAQVWRNSNGQLDQVVRAILLDPEARNLSTSELNPEYGRKKEPIVAWIQAVRAAGSRSRVTFDGTVISGDPIDFPNQTHQGTINPTADGDLRNFDYPQSSVDKFQGMVMYDGAGQMVPDGTGTFARLPATRYRIGTLDGGGTVSLGQSPLKAPTVFNWFLPDYQPGGLIASFGKVAPEFQIATESSVFQNVNTYWQSHWGTSGFGGSVMGGNNANSAAAGYSTTLGTRGTNYTDDNVIPDYWAWINRYLNYPTIPTNNLNDEQDRDLQLVDDLDDLLLAGRFKLLYPVDASDDGAPTTQGGLPHVPGRNPRETLLYYLGDTYGTNSSNTWNKVRATLYIMGTSPEFLIQK